MEVEILSRIQFGFTVGFHILFPTLNLGLAVFLAIVEGLWLKTQNPFYLNIAKFWTKIFALTFGMGVVSGVVLAYELGTNFSNFTQAFGSVIGPLFVYEVLTAFFLEAGFLGIMLFGWHKVKPSLHYFATLMVAIGTTISAFWIMSANSWMQTPTGFDFINGEYFVHTWREVVFNPSFLPRLFHMILASYLTTAFVIAGISAWYLLKQRHVAIAKFCFSLALWGALVVAPIQMFIGDMAGLNVYKHQPMKLAAMEGRWDTMQSAPLILFAIPDSRAEKNHWEIKIPYLASLITTHSLDGVVPGLKEVSAEDRPVVGATFYGFRIMVGIGLWLFAIALYALWLRYKGRLYQSQLLQRLCIFSIPLGFIATLAGWITAESGRQPWVVNGLMRTADSVSPVANHNVFFSLMLFMIVYVIVFGFYLYYVIKLIRKGPLDSSRGAT